MADNNPNAANQTDASVADAAPALPTCIMVQDYIGWYENGCLRSFNEGDIVSNASDIARLIGAGAIYLQVNQ